MSDLTSYNVDSIAILCMQHLLMNQMQVIHILIVIKLSMTMTVYKHILEQNLLANVEEFDV